MELSIRTFGNQSDNEFTDPLLSFEQHFNGPHNIQDALKDMSASADNENPAHRDAVAAKADFDHVINNLRAVVGSQVAKQYPDACLASVKLILDPYPHVIEAMRTAVHNSGLFDVRVQNDVDRQLGELGITLGEMHDHANRQLGGQDPHTVVSAARAEHRRMKAPLLESSPPL